MCVFIPEVIDVNSTRIFARIDGTRQAIIYEMYLATEGETAMVLPIPVAKGCSENSVEFVDLSDYSEIFSDIEGLFPADWGLSSLSFSAPELSHSVLEIVEVGVFEASFVPSPKDFDRLDVRFRVKDILFQKNPEYEDYGFVVFKLKPGESKVHPMAFWFPTRCVEKLYYPTVHMHDGEMHDYEKFSHTLYAQGDIEGPPGINYANMLTERMLYKSVVEYPFSVIPQDKTSGDEDLLPDPFIAGNHPLGKQKLIDSIANNSKGLVSCHQRIGKLEVKGRRKNKDIWLGISCAA